MLRCESSEHSDISRMADWDMPVYWIVSFSLSGLNLKGEREHVSLKTRLLEHFIIEALSIHD